MRHRVGRAGREVLGSCLEGGPGGRGGGGGAAGAVREYLVGHRAAVAVLGAAGVSAPPALHWKARGAARLAAARRRSRVLPPPRGPARMCDRPHALGEGRAPVGAGRGVETAGLMQDT